jgi:hypothetical protein
MRSVLLGLGLGLISPLSLAHATGQAHQTQGPGSTPPVRTDGAPGSRDKAPPPASEPTQGAPRFCMRNAQGATHCITLPYTGAH